jgi:hypothetical protein
MQQAVVACNEIGVRCLGKSEVRRISRSQPLPYQLLCTFPRLPQVKCDPAANLTKHGQKLIPLCRIADRANLKVMDR